MRSIDFENIEQKFDEVLESKEWKKFQEDFVSSTDIYIVANGGLWAVANHAADDCNRLFAKAGIKKTDRSQPPEQQRQRPLTRKHKMVF